MPDKKLLSSFCIILNKNRIHVITYIIMRMFVFENYTDQNFYKN